MQGSRYCCYDTPFGVLYLYIQEATYFFCISLELLFGWGVQQNGRNRTAFRFKTYSRIHNRRYKNIKESNNEMMTTLAYYVSSWVGPQKGELSICIWSTQHERTNETMAEFVKSSFWSVFVLTGRRCWRRRSDWETRSVSLGFCLFIWRVCICCCCAKSNVNRDLFPLFGYSINWLITRSDIYRKIIIEEWIKKRKVEQVTTKQIETRVKRQVVVTEDGEVVDDSGPQVTTNTHEDTETKQEEHTEVCYKFYNDSCFCCWLLRPNTKKAVCFNACTSY